MNLGAGIDAPSHQGRGPTELLTTALFFGLLASLGEIAGLVMRKFVFGKMLLLGPDLVWMIPLANAVLFLGLALPLWTAARIWPRLDTPRLRTAVFSFLAVICVLFVSERMHRGAAVLLAAGVAVQVSRLCSGHLLGFRSLLNRVTPMLVMLAVIAGVSTTGLRVLRERGELAALPVAREDAPNIILLILDTVRAMNLSLYGYARETTPNLEQLAQRGTTFDFAVAPAPWTLPTHASLFTGRDAHELSTDFTTPLDDRYPTLAEVLQRGGYQTAGFVANTFYAGYEFGLDRGFIHYEDYPVDVEEIVLSSSMGRALSRSQRIRRLIGHFDIFPRKNAAEINAAFLQWVSRSDHRQPFFAFLNYLDAHEPYLPPLPYAEQFGSQAARRLDRLDYRQLRNATRWGRRSMAAAEKTAEADAYDGALAYLDHQVAELMAELGRRGLLDNSIVIITSDHGEFLGEHGRWGHGGELYMQVLHVPLLLLAPGRAPAGIRIATPVSLRDLPATILDLADVTNALPGTSLAESWQGDGAERAGLPLLSAFRDRSLQSWSVIDQGYHYIRNADGREEVYDLSADPFETVDLSGATAGTLLDQLRRALPEPQVKASAAGSVTESRSN